MKFSPDRGREKKRAAAPKGEVPINGRRKRNAACPNGADIVEKVHFR
jgi:hypothetical protein